MKGTPVSKDTIAAIMHLYSKGNSGRSIAEELEMPRTTVHRIISSNSMTITSRASVSREAKKSISKTAKATVNAATRKTFAPFVIPAGAPICNATATGIYRGAELSYRQSRA